MTNFWNNTAPSSVNFTIDHGTAYSPPPLNKPLPNNILPPGSTPALPVRAVPAPTGNLKKALNKLPSIFNLNIKNS